MNEPYRDVEFPRVYPQESVPDHVVLMSFNGDPDAIAFHDWWHEQGAVAFNRWLKERQGER